MEKATEELEEAERLEVEARREAVALQEQIEKMIQVKISKERCQSEENALIQVWQWNSSKRVYAM